MDSCSADHAPARTFPKIAYVLLWFPLSSETFIFREVKSLLSLGLSIQVYTMYGKSLKGCSDEMRAFSGRVRHYGVFAAAAVLGAFFRALRREPRKVAGLLREGFFRRMRDLESLGENLWCFMVGFLLAEQCLDEGVSLIHSAWANGPATAAWVASRLTGLPFAFTGRAGDIYPEDGLLREKSRDAIFLRTNNLSNVRWLQQFCPTGQKDKVHLVYNSLTFAEAARERPTTARRHGVFNILAIGRFARTKGFPELFTALARLRRERVPVRLTLVGDGRWRGRLLRQLRRMRLRDSVDLPGFVPHDQTYVFMCSHDLLVVPSVVHNNGDRDGIPNVIMEALSCGLPVVATNVNGIPEVVRNGETGLLVPQRDPAALAGAVRQMLENRERALAMARNGKALVERMFDGETNIRALRDLYMRHAGATAQAPDAAPC
ncbi:MAG: glycosyltransferase family 4 protein [Desulfovibrio sp.]|jgi:glycosyltransferase involved in cell wall biosynthesis|nr:glycosyltransferase family 4 protein [Desulfovibrio sp.]